MIEFSPKQADVQTFRPNLKEFCAMKACKQIKIACVELSSQQQSPKETEISSNTYERRTKETME